MKKRKRKPHNNPLYPCDDTCFGMGLHYVDKQWERRRKRVLRMKLP